jgi:hypothetical protein
MTRRIRSLVVYGAMTLALGALPATAFASDHDESDTTPLTVRVIAAGAKWVSPELGGADVWVRDAVSGEVLATGRIEGDSGDTTALMETAHTRSQPIPITDTSGKVTLDVPLDEARQVIVGASGPRLGDGHVASATASVWMVPGAELGGDEGVVLEVHGLAVSFLAPGPHTVTTSDGAVEVEVLAAVEMLCGCPIGPSTPWPPEDYVVQALAFDSGTEAARATLDFAGTDSRFSGSITLPGPGVYELQIVATQTDVANVGVARNGYVVTAPTSD